MRTRRTAAGAAAGVVVLALAVGCSDSGSYSGQDSTPTSTATTASVGAAGDVCDAAAQVRTAFEGVVSDVRAKNLGDARAAITDVTSALDDLVSAVDALGDEKKAEVQPDLDQAQDALASLGGATSLADVTSALGSARSSLRSALGSVDGSFGCDSAGGD